MFFEIKNYADDGEPEVGIPALSMYQWYYRQGTAENPGGTICQSVRSFDNEPACRKDVAAARKAFSGSRFAKVVSA